MNTNGIWSSMTDEWYTPQDLFDKLNEEFHFNLDPCATKENHKCELYYTKEDDGLQKNWNGFNVFCNPPYGRQIGKWVEKAYNSNALTVMLLPARTDTKWFHEYIYNKSEIRFLKGRIKFGGCKKFRAIPINDSYL